MNGNLSKRKGLLSTLGNEELENIKEAVSERLGESLGGKADKAEVNAELDKKADKSEIYTKDELDERITEIETYPSMLEEVVCNFEEAVSKLDKGITTNSNNISEIHIDMGTMVEAFENRIVGVENGLNEKADASSVRNVIIRNKEDWKQLESTEPFVGVVVCPFGSFGSAIDNEGDFGKECGYGIDEIQEWFFIYSFPYKSMGDGYVIQMCWMYDGSLWYRTLNIESTVRYYNSFDLIFSPNNVPNREETNAAISEAIGNVETALENIISNYGLGGDEL